MHAVAEAKTPAQSQVEATHIVLPSDTNALGTLFGGQLVQWIDIAAAVAARRHCGGVAVTASVDSLHFLHAVHVGDVVVLRAAVNRSWKTSMEIGVRAECESATSGKRIVAASAYLTFVCIDSDGKPQAVPAVRPESADEKRRFRQAEERREHRLKGRQSQSKG